MRTRTGKTVPLPPLKGGCCVPGCQRGPAALTNVPATMIVAGGRKKVGAQGRRSAARGQLKTERW